jgi:hypothetical protein
VATDFQDLATAAGTAVDICERIATDETRISMLLEAIALRNKGSLSLPDLQMQRLLQSIVELRFLAKNCADTSRFLSECGEEIGAPSHYFLLTRALPRVYEKHFHRRFGRSTVDERRTGPGVRFVMAAAELVGIYKPDGKPYSAETLRTAEREIRKRKERTGSE